MFLGVVGCKETVKDTSTQNLQVSNQSQQEQKTTPSFPIKTYNTPFLTFNYPASWEEDKEITSPDLIIGLINPNDKLNFLYIGKLKTSETNLENVINTTKLSGMYDTKVINKGYINNQCYYTEYYVNYNPITHNKMYIYQSGDSFYKATISIEDSKWENFKEVVQVFEQSLEFKQ